MIYIVTTFDIEKNEDNFLIKSSEDNSYFTNLYNAQSSVVNNIADINEAGAYNYVTIRGVVEGLMYANTEISNFFLYKFNNEEKKYEYVKPDTDIHSFLVKHYGILCKNVEEPKIKLDLNKQETNFVDSIKSSIENKKYDDVFNMLSRKEETFSEDINNQLNDFVKAIEDGFSQIENSVNNFINKFNK